MRAACCEATVLRHEVIADGHPPADRGLWPDRDHAPHAGQFFTLRAWGADEAPVPLPAHQRPQVGARDRRPWSSCIRSSARAPRSWQPLKAAATASS